MRKLLATLLVLTCGFGLGLMADKVANPKTSVHAQSSANTMTCYNGGLSVVCSQYVVQVSVIRGFPRFVVYQAGSPIDTSAMVNEGNGAAVSVNAFEPGARGANTFTLALSEP